MVVAVGGGVICLILSVHIRSVSPSVEVRIPEDIAVTFDSTGGVGSLKQFNKKIVYMRQMIIDCCLMRTSVTSSLHQKAMFSYIFKPNLT